MAKTVAEKHADEDVRTEAIPESLTEENCKAVRETTLVFDSFLDCVRGGP